MNLSKFAVKIVLVFSIALFIHRALWQYRANIVIIYTVHIFRYQFPWILRNTYYANFCLPPITNSNTRRALCICFQSTCGTAQREIILVTCVIVPHSLYVNNNHRYAYNVFCYHECNTANNQTNSSFKLNLHWIEWIGLGTAWLTHLSSKTYDYARLFLLFRRVVPSH